MNAKTDTKPKAVNGKGADADTANQTSASQLAVDALVASTKSESELLAIFEALGSVVKDKVSRKQTDAIAQIEAIALDAKLTVTIKGHKKPNANAKTYQNPSNASEQFVMDGVNKRPDWLKNLIKAGKKLKDLEVKVTPAPATNTSQVTSTAA